MSHGTVKIELTSRQLGLLIEYAYPFENEEKQLLANPTFFALVAIDNGLVVGISRGL